MITRIVNPSSTVTGADRLERSEAKNHASKVVFVDEKNSVGENYINQALWKSHFHWIVPLRRAVLSGAQSLET